MPIISFANPKGGTGKTTSALLLATQLAERGANVAVIDADPERWIARWANLPAKPCRVSVSDAVTEDSIIDLIEQSARRAQFVIIDLEGTASLMVANAIGMSDLVLIPLQGSSMDARGGAKMLHLLRNQERLVRRRIPYGVVLTRTNPAITSRTLRNVQHQLAENGVEVLHTAIVERAAYREMFDYGGGLADLDPQQVSNLDKARTNAAIFVGEVLARLRSAGAGETTEAH